MAIWPVIMPGFRRKPPLSCLLIICQPSGWHNYPEVCEAVRPKQTEGRADAKCTTGARAPWPSAILHFAHRPVNRRFIPKRGCIFGFTIRCCAPLRGPVRRRRGPKRAASLGALARPRGRTFLRFLAWLRHAGSGGQCVLRTFDTAESGAAFAGRQRHGDGAAYRACCVIECEREGRTHDYSHKGGREAGGIVLPEDAPAWAKDRAKLWNAIELRERNKDKRAKTKFKADAQDRAGFDVHLSG